MKIGLCVLGCGNFAKTFAESIQPLLINIDLYFASRNVHKARQYNQEFNGVGAFGSYREAVDNPSIKATYICTPHHVHLEHSILSAKSGKHILVEKPISNTVQSAKDIIAAAEQHNVKLMVAENYRFMPCVQLCKQLIDQGAIGKVRTIQIQQESPYKAADWRKDPHKNGGGVFIDAGIHKIHFLRYILGEPYSIYAAAPNFGGDNQGIEDGMIFTAKWGSGEVGLIYHSWTYSNIHSNHWVSVSGTQGRIYFELIKQTLHLEKGGTSQIIKISDPPNGILAMTQEFINSITQNRLPEMTGEEGLKDLILVHKAYESAKTATSISL